MLADWRRCEISKISVYLDSKSNKDNIVQVPTTTVGKNEWTKISAQIKSSADEDGALAILFEGNGSLQLDCVSLCDVDIKKVQKKMVRK